MSWTYSGDPNNSQLDELRFIVQDTDSTVPLLSNEELQYLLDNWMPRYDSVIWVASIAAQSISRKFAGLADISADGVRAGLSSISKNYADMATQLRWEYAQAQSSGEVDISNLMYDTELDSGIKPLTFGIGMHDNYEAGQQDYAGTDTVVLFDELVERER